MKRTIVTVAVTSILGLLVAALSCGSSLVPEEPEKVPIPAGTPMSKDPEFADWPAWGRWNISWKRYFPKRPLYLPRPGRHTPFR